MKVLLDTNIIIHRESTQVIREDIGILFNWIDKLKYTKYIHPITVQEINKLKADKLRNLMNVKMGSYNVIKVVSPIHVEVAKVGAAFDKTENDRNDTILLNELYLDRVDFLITEDRKIGHKAALLDISERVFTIDSFLEKVTTENPDLTDYKVLSIRKDYFGNININDEFFKSFKIDYPRFANWFNKKSEDTAYICQDSGNITAFLYLKVENKNEPYHDIEPSFKPKRRLKIGTFKVTLNGYKLGERFLKIIFDNAIRYSVEEIYVTIFDKSLEQQRLICLLEDFGFMRYGIKHNQFGDELVYTRDMAPQINRNNPRLMYPYFSQSSRIFIVPIYPEYHTQLLPDSILRTEAPKDFIDNEPFRNAISKVYVSRSYFRELIPGDTIVFYRTGGIYKGVATTIGIVENVQTNIKDVHHFILLCRKRSVFTDQELTDQWNYSNRSKPFIVNFLYTYSFPKRPNLKKLIDIGIISDVQSVPRGFAPINSDAFKRLLKEAEVDTRFVID